MVLVALQHTIDITVDGEPVLGRLSLMQALYRPLLGMIRWYCVTATDPSGSALTTWDFGDTGTGKVFHTYSSTGSYTVSVTATLAQSTSTASVDITVTSTQHQIIQSLLQVTTTFVQAEPLILLYQEVIEWKYLNTWDFGDGNTGSGKVYHILTLQLEPTLLL